MKEIRPNFDDLNDPNSWKGNDDQNRKELEARKLNLTNPFPIEVFPKSIQDIIRATNQCLLYPIDFISTSILCTLSISIGNTHRIEIMKGWTEIATLYTILVGPSGTIKSHAVTYAIHPLQSTDAKAYKEYEAKKKEYDKYQKMTKEEKKAAGLNDLELPIWKQVIVSDSTPEALADVHKYNLRGIALYYDEIASWTKNFNRYNSGSEEEFWLSCWSGKPITINRKTSGNTLIQLPFIPIIGTTQPGVLVGLAVNRVQNGFLDRILFVIPDNLKKESWSESELPSSITESWQLIITKLTSMTLRIDELGDLQPEVLKLSPEAKKCLFEWQKALTERSNESGDDDERSIHAKMEIYAARFALILELSKYACEGTEGSSRDSISQWAVEGAIKLAEYFIKNAFKARDLLTNDDPLSKLPENKKTLYFLLQQTFTTEEGLKISEPFLKVRAAKKFFGDKQIFKRVKHGQYEKL